MNTYGYIFGYRGEVILSHTLQVRTPIYFYVKLLF